MIKREIFQLTDAEFRAKQRLPREQNVAWNFWRMVADRLAIDYETIMPNYSEPHSRRSFTALPKGHGKWWCYPLKLKCSIDPATVKIEEWEYNAYN